MDVNDLTPAVEGDSRRIAVIAEGEIAWMLFVRSGQAANAGDGALQQAQKALEHRAAFIRKEKGARERFVQGAERIRRYLAGGGPR